MLDKLFHHILYVKVKYEFLKLCSVGFPYTVFVFQSYLSVELSTSYVLQSLFDCLFCFCFCHIPEIILCLHNFSPNFMSPFFFMTQYCFLLTHCHFPSRCYTNLSSFTLYKLIHCIPKRNQAKPKTNTRGHQGFRGYYYTSTKSPLLQYDSR